MIHLIQAIFTMRFAFVTFATLTFVAGCSFSLPVYHCDSSTQCRPGSTCIAPAGLCAIPDPSCQPGGLRYEDYSGDLSGMCVGQQSSDGGIDTPPGQVCYGGRGTPAGIVSVCFSSAPTMDITLSGPFDTDTASQCVTPASDGTGYCVVAANSITIDDSLDAKGMKPLILVAVTSITIASNATLDVASHNNVIPRKLGAGAGSLACAAGTAPTAGAGGGGGAGGAFAGAGGTGGNGGGGNGGMPGAAQAATSLRGGCPGQNGINGTFGAGGNGGGAVYLIAGTQIVINANGAINASGEGGLPGITGSAGAGGGGSGGMIGLDAPVIMNAGMVYANGASGGEGSGAATAGRAGPEPAGIAASGIAAGGTGNGGDGGGGSAGSPTDAGQLGSNGSGGGTPGGGGGGGGGIGVIRVFGGGTLGGMRSPT